MWSCGNGEPGLTWRLMDDEEVKDVNCPNNQVCLAFASLYLSVHAEEPNFSPSVFDTVRAQ
jgi:hypothetical protein